MRADDDFQSMAVRGRRVDGKPAWTWSFGCRGGKALVMSLSKVQDSHRQMVGGKIANLARALQSGLPVPVGFCITTTAFAGFLGACPRRGELTAILEEAARNGWAETGTLSRRASACLADTAVPQSVSTAVLKAWRAGGADRAYAVRSSATVEDAKDRSFAGQFESFLNVQGPEALLAAVKACWLSVFAERGLVYQTKRGLPPGPVEMAVLVQEMIPAETAGVLFSVDPVSGDRSQMVIEAIAGLGDQLVQGKVTPESAVLDKSTLGVIRRRSGSGPTCLDAALAREIGELGLRAERLFGSPQDMEWAAAGGRVFLLQSRPVTGLKDSLPEVWTNANVMEALPDVVTPLSWSLMLLLMEDFLYPLMRRLGLRVGPPPLVKLFAGRAYLNLSGVSGLVQRVGPLRVDIASTFGGRYPQAGTGPTAGSAMSLNWRNLKAAARALRLGAWVFPGLFGQQKLIERWGDRAFGYLAHTPPEDLSDTQLASYPRTVIRLASQGAGERTWAAAAWMGACAVGGSLAVFKLAHRWLGDSDGSLANRLLAGAGSMNSAENGLALYRLAAWAKERPVLAAALLAPGSFADLRERLTAVESGPEFLERWRAFMLQHGHQARGGMDLAQPRWSEMPDHVLRLLRACLEIDAATNPVRLQAQRLEQRTRLVEDCRRRLENPFKRRLFLALVRASQRGLRQRENVKNEGVRMVAMLRRAVLEAGRRLTQRGLLRHCEEVFFLNLEEMEAAVAGKPTLDPRAIVAERRALHERNLKLNPPPTITGSYDEDAPAAGEVSADATVFQGVPVSPGRVTGRARVIQQADADARVLPGEILVAPYTDPGWTPYFLPAAGVVVDVGGLLSHGSVVAREYGLPAVVNVGTATRLIRTGDLVQVDGARGVVTLLERAGT